MIIALELCEAKFVAFCAPAADQKNIMSSWKGYGSLFIDSPAEFCAWFWTPQRFAAAVF
jgi:hypothetical protein